MSKFQLGPKCALLAVFLLVACCSYATCEHLDTINGSPQYPEVRIEDEGGRHLAVMELNGRRYSAPSFENAFTSEARRKFDGESITKIVKRLRDLVNLVIVEKRSHFKVAKTAVAIVPTFAGVSRDLKKFQKTDNSQRMYQGYTGKMSNFILEMMAHKTDERIDDKEAQQRSEDLLIAIERIVTESPTGLYLDWPQFKVDDQLLITYVSPIIRWCRDNGYSMELKIFDGLATVLKAFTPSQKKHHHHQQS